MLCTQMQNNDKHDAATTAATITITPSPSVSCRNCKAAGLLEPATPIDAMAHINKALALALRT